MWAIGGGAGAAIGNEVGGRDGAIIGGAVGAAVTTDDNDHCDSTIEKHAITITTTIITVRISVRHARQKRGIAEPDNTHSTGTTISETAPSEVVSFYTEDVPCT